VSTSNRRTSRQIKQQRRIDLHGIAVPVFLPLASPQSGKREHERQWILRQMPKSEFKAEGRSSLVLRIDKKRVNADVFQYAP
jgi:hypothetical protein